MNTLISILAGIAIGFPLGAILMLYIGLKLTDAHFDEVRAAIAKAEGQS